MKEDSKNDLFEKAPIPRAYFTFALPVVFSMVVSLVYNMVDTFFYRPDRKYRSGGGSFFKRSCFYIDDRSGRYFRTGRKLGDLPAFRPEAG